MNLRSPNYSLQEFSESVKDFGVLEILDAITDEIGVISRQCKQLGFGYMPKKGSKARSYYEDLMFLVPLYTNTDLPKFREGFVEEARAMLSKMSQNLVSLENLKMESSYQVFVDDNYHYQDEDERYKLGDFATFEEAVTACKAIVDEYLQQNYKESVTADELYESYVGFGEDPFIVGEPVHFRFSAWNYAKERCHQICG